MCSGNFEPKWLFKIFIFLLMNIISQNMYQQYLLSKHTCIKHQIHLKWNETQNMHFTYTHTHRKPCACVPHGHSPFRYHLLTWQCSRGKGNWKVLRYNSFSFFTIKLKKKFISILKDVTSCGLLIWFYHRSLSLHFHNLWVLTG